MKSKVRFYCFDKTVFYKPLSGASLSMKCSWSRAVCALFIVYLLHSRQAGAPPAAPPMATEVQVPTKALREITETKWCGCPFTSPAPSINILIGTN